VDELRREGRRPSIGSNEIDSGNVSPGADAHLDGSDWATDILARIPARQSEVVFLRVVAGLCVADVAELLGISEGNVRVLSHRGLQAIQRVLIERGLPADTEAVPSEDEIL
jgi:DNA-directed RNA polymerase specialized sigma24 family protein